MAENEKLTVKQDKFINELIKGKSQREAYRAAFAPKKMTDKSIDEKACTLFKTVKVQSRYKELLKKVQDKAEQEGILEAVDVLKGLSKIANDDISNYLDFYPDVDGNVHVDIKDSRKIDTSNISEVSVGRDGQFKFKLYCKDNALVQLGRIKGMYIEKTENVVTISNSYDTLTIEQLEKMRNDGNS